ncbi:unnamed protein product [Arctogadus glacialis]
MLRLCPDPAAPDTKEASSKVFSPNHYESVAMDTHDDLYYLGWEIKAGLLTPIPRFCGAGVCKTYKKKQTHGLHCLVRKRILRILDSLAAGTRSSDRSGPETIHQLFNLHHTCGASRGIHSNYRSDTEFGSPGQLKEKRDQVDP